MNIEQLFASLGGGEPMPITGDDYGSRTARAMGMDGNHPMARRAIGKDREEVLREFGTSGGNQDVYDYVDSAGDEANPEGFKTFIEERLVRRVPFSIKDILGAFTEGGALDPDREAFGKPLGQDIKYAKAVEEFRVRIENITTGLNKAIVAEARAEYRARRARQDAGLPLDL